MDQPSLVCLPPLSKLNLGSLLKYVGEGPAVMPTERKACKLLHHQHNRRAPAGLEDRTLFPHEQVQQEEVDGPTAKVQRAHNCPYSARHLAYFGSSCFSIPCIHYRGPLSVMNMTIILGIDVHMAMCRHGTGQSTLHGHRTCYSLVVFALRD